MASEYASPASHQSPTEVNGSQNRIPSNRLALGLGVLSSCAGAEPHYFGFSAGLSLAHFVQVAIDSGGTSSDISLPLLADRPFSSPSSKTDTKLADAPTFEDGARYILAYLTSAHPLYPFMQRSRVWQLHNCLTKPQAGDTSGIEKVDETIIHLIYAIGSRCLQLLGKHGVPNTVPGSHFLRAMKNINEDLRFSSTKSIEVTLLLAIHSMRSPYGMSPANPVQLVSLVLIF